MELFTIIIGTLGGVSGILAALFTYFGNLRLEKFKADLAETNAKVKAALDSSVHVSKAQFDKEFAIYQTIWMRLVALRAITLSLSPIMDHFDPNEAEEERIHRRLKPFRAAFFAFRDAMEENKPFYAIAVYESLCQIFDICRATSTAYQYKVPGWSKEYWDNSNERSQQIISSIDDCCQLIRGRVASLSVV